MRTAIALLTAFVIPFCILGFTGHLLPADTGKESRDLVERWLSSQKAGELGEEYWTYSAQPLVLRNVIDWEFTESSKYHVIVTVNSMDRQYRQEVSEDYRLAIGNGFDESSTVLVPKIERIESLGDSLGYYARRAQDHVEDWLLTQRAGESGIEFWAIGSSPSRLYSVSAWEVVNAPSNDPTTAINVIVDSATKGGHPIRNTWKVVVEHVPKKYSEVFEPKILRLVNLSE